MADKKSKKKRMDVRVREKKRGRSVEETLFGFCCGQLMCTENQYEYTNTIVLSEIVPSYFR